MINISAKISHDLGMVPGGEFRRAVEEVFNYPSFNFYDNINFFILN